MKEKIIKLFEALGKFKLTFNPAIRIQMTPHSHPTWIDDMCKVNNNYMVTVSTQEDGCKKSLDNLSEEQMQSLVIRLNSLQGK